MIVAAGEFLSATIFVVWIVLTLVAQIEWRWKEKLIRWNAFGIIPYYSFFAPFPGRFDYHLVVRILPSEGEVSRWFEVDRFGNRPWYGFLFNPQKRPRKAMFDMVAELLSAARTHPADERLMYVSYPYLAFLIIAQNFVERESRYFWPRAYQYAIIAGCNDNSVEFELLFCSAMHPCEPEPLQIHDQYNNPSFI